MWIKRHVRKSVVLKYLCYNLIDMCLYAGVSWSRFKSILQLYRSLQKACARILRLRWSWIYGHASIHAIQLQYWSCLAYSCSYWDNHLYCMVAACLFGICYKAIITWSKLWQIMPAFWISVIDKAQSLCSLSWDAKLMKLSLNVLHAKHTMIDYHWVIVDQ